MITALKQCPDIRDYVFTYLDDEDKYVLALTHKMFQTNIKYEINVPYSWTGKHPTKLNIIRIDMIYYASWYNYASLLEYVLKNDHKIKQIDYIKNAQHKTCDILIQLHKNGLEVINILSHTVWQNNIKLIESCYKKYPEIMTESNKEVLVLEAFKYGNIEILEYFKNKNYQFRESHKYIVENMMSFSMVPYKAKYMLKKWISENVQTCKK